MFMESREDFSQVMVQNQEARNAAHHLSDVMKVPYLRLQVGKDVFWVSRDKGVAMNNEQADLYKKAWEEDEEKNSTKRFIEEATERHSSSNGQNVNIQEFEGQVATLTRSLTDYDPQQIGIPFKIGDQWFDYKGKLSDENNAQRFEEQYKTPNQE